MALSPKRRVIRDRVLRRAVTRGVDTLWWAKLEREKKKDADSEQEPDLSLNGLGVAMFVLFALLFSIITKSC